jgi:iron complex outermembrane receptor protein
MQRSIFRDALVGSRYVCALWLLIVPVAGVHAAEVNIMDLSLEDLGNLQITSVARRPQSISEAPASVYIITAEDIRRSGATTLPEILRLAPNLQVARVDSVQYAITARGFNNAIGNKLLVLQDGRTLYTPLFSGVFWEMEDTMLQDIERIEVFSGSGATLWGANAVNGVINIITRQSSETQGAIVAGEAGDRESGVAARIGGRVNAQLHWRAYAKTRKWDNTGWENGGEAPDAWKKSQAGFRADWKDEVQGFTLQGDVYNGESEHRGIYGPVEIPAVEVSGTNLLARWTRELNSASGDNELQVQAYWSHSEREEFILFSPESDILDIEFQHGFTRGAHRVVWGAGYRHAEDDVGPGFQTAFIPRSAELNWHNIYIRDEVALAETIRLAVGIKSEWNEYTGTEYLPGARLSWNFADDHMVWLAASRAVRAPSRIDRDVFLPQTPPFMIAGGPNFQAESALAYELGYRGQLSDTLNVSGTLFLHRWDKLRSGTKLPLPMYISNGIEGDAQGAEGWFNWQPLPLLRFGGGFLVLDKDLQFKAGAGDTAGVDNAVLHNDPDYQWQLRSDIDLGNDVQLNLNLRKVDELTVEPVPGYHELNARLSWQPRPALEVALTGRNLLDDAHAEFGAITTRSRIDRSILLGFRWTY